MPLEISAPEKTLIKLRDFFEEKIINNNKTRMYIREKNKAKQKKYVKFCDSGFANVGAQLTGER